MVLHCLLMVSMVCAAAADGNEPVQMKLHKSLRLWSFYVDLEESLGTLESTRAVYERILDLRIATPQIILNYAFFLEVEIIDILPLVHFSVPNILTASDIFLYYRSTSTLRMHLRCMKEV